ncbi:FecR family protein [Alteromonas sp. 76-1]|jgi:transmembrane sensor|uniref:FecR family protein n=1 Tax=Alteromonas sp. 76-1 TaxID=2358187 RepID=UPI000FD17819|nr:FecR domain-containing protein [Alteromonas sp. 76-1]VEL96682.1 FecR family protein [Alteromonas sp. 76-1]
MTDNRTQFEVATDWYYQLKQANITTEEIQLWQEWLAQDKGNAEAFKKVEELMCLTSSIEEISWPDDRELIDDGYDGEVSVKEHLKNKKSRFSIIKSYMKNIDVNFNITTRKPIFLYFSFLLSFILIADLVHCGLGFDHMNSEVVYQSDKGVNLPIVLDDGSEITLGADSKITVTYTDKNRHILLNYGEAYFDVAKDPLRPFTVDSGNRSVTALGTEFNISQQSIRSVVSVTEGKVIVEPESEKYIARMTTNLFYKKLETDTFLEAGQRISYDEKTITTVDSVDVDAHSSWRNGTLKYINESLGFVIEDINRYSKTPIIVNDNRILNLRYSGTIFVNGINGWIDSLPHIYPIKVDKNNNEFNINYNLKT